MIPVEVDVEALPTPLTRQRRSPKLFADDRDQPRTRRPTDAISLGTAALGLGLLAATARPQLGFSRSVELFFTSLPGFLVGFWQLAVDVPFAIALIIIIAASARRRYRIARDVVLAGFVAGAVGFLLIRAVDGGWPSGSVWSAEPTPPFPAIRVAVAASMLIVASPHLVAPARVLQRWVIGFAAAGTMALGASNPIGAAAGLLVAMGAAALLHLIVGSSAGRPSLASVQLGLGELGVHVSGLVAADTQRAGVFVVHADDGDPAPLLVKVYGRDAHDTALLGQLWRTVWLREPGALGGFGRQRQVEHEAFLTLLARQSGTTSDLVVTAGATETDDALLVLRRVGRPLATLPASEQAAVIDGLWTTLATLHTASITHGSVDVDHLMVREGRVELSGFRAAAVAPTEARLQSDQVQALVTTALITGEDRALDAAIDAIGPDGVAAALPFLQPAMLTPNQRHQVRQGALDLDDFRALTAETIGIASPELQQLRRFTIGSIVRIALPLLALYLIASAIANFDFEAVATELADATWWIAVIGFVVAQLPRVGQAIATLGASPVALPLGPVYALQLSVSYVNLVIPSAAARMAVNIRFFQRHGVPPGGALAAGGLDGLSGFVVQAIILVSMLVFGTATLDVELDLSGSGPSARLLLFVGGIAAVAIAVVALVARFRNFIVHWVKQILHEMRSAISGLRSPRRLAMLFGGNIASELLFASALGLFARAFGADIGLGELLFINVTVALLSGLIPIPGGIGVTEGGLIFGLVSAGMNQEAAFAAVISYRVATFYLPPIWGFFSLRWLERNQHL